MEELNISALTFCPSCGVRYQDEPDGSRTYYWSFKNTQVSQEGVINKVCKYVKDPEKIKGCINNQSVEQFGQTWNGEFLI